MADITKKFVLHRDNFVKLKLEQGLSLPGNNWYVSLKEFAMEAKWSLSKENIVIIFKNGYKASLKPTIAHTSNELDKILDEMFFKKREKRQGTSSDLLGDITGVKIKKVKSNESSVDQNTQNTEVSKSKDLSSSENYNNEKIPEANIQEKSEDNQKQTESNQVIKPITSNNNVEEVKTTETVKDGSKNGSQKEVTDSGKNNQENKSTNALSSDINKNGAKKNEVKKDEAKKGEVSKNGPKIAQEVGDKKQSEAKEKSKTPTPTLPKSVEIEKDNVSQEKKDNTSSISSNDKQNGQSNQKIPEVTKSISKNNFYDYLNYPSNEIWDPERDFNKNKIIELDTNQIEAAEIIEGPANPGKAEALVASKPNNIFENITSGKAYPSGKWPKKNKEKEKTSNPVNPVYEKDVLSGITNADKYPSGKWPKKDKTNDVGEAADDNFKDTEEVTVVEESSTDNISDQSKKTYPSGKWPKKPDSDQVGEKDNDPSSKPLNKKNKIEEIYSYDNYQIEDSKPIVPIDYYGYTFNFEEHEISLLPSIKMEEKEVKIEIDDENDNIKLDYNIQILPRIKHVHQSSYPHVETNKKRFDTIKIALASDESGTTSKKKEYTVFTDIKAALKYSPEIFIDANDFSLMGFKSIEWEKNESKQYVLRYDKNYVRAIYLSDGFKNAMGFKDNFVFYDDIALNTPRTDTHYSHVCVFLKDIVDQEAEIAIIPIEKENSKVHAIYSNPLSFKVDKTYIDTIYLEFKNFDNSFISCDNARCFISLKFFKK